MNKLVCCAILLFLSVAACDKAPDETYRPPIFTGTAYVLSGANHIAVVDLKSQDLSRVMIDKKGVDLASGDSGIYLLSEDGYLAFLPKGSIDRIKWQKVVGRGVALAAAAAGDDDGLWVLGVKEVLLITPKGEVLRRHDLPEPASSLVFDGEHTTIWLINREKGEAVGLDSKSFVAGKTITQLGNSVHQGFAFPGKSELWIAEGNEYMDGKPYGVGFAKKGPAMMGGINVFDSETGKQLDFVMVGGNVIDLVLGPDKAKAYVALSRRPDYSEASLAILDSESRRTLAELRLCQACHDSQAVEIPGGQAEVLAIEVLWAAELEGK